MGAQGYFLSESNWAHKSYKKQTYKLITIVKKGIREIYKTHLTQLKNN